jgi:alginate O-acetyltransferase complex protein AlgI
MLFNSLNFAFFFLVVSGIYFVLPYRFQNIFLLISSYFFYGSWSIYFLFLILISTFIDYFCALMIFHYSSMRLKKLYLGISIVTNLGILGFFKYFNFFAENLAELFLFLFQISLDPLILDYVLPVGISFYTFQTLSYTLDVYEGRLLPCKNPIDFALFVAFFPQLVAGPIERSTNLIPQIQRPRHFSREAWFEAGWLIYWGLFKKIYIADNLAIFVDSIFNPKLQTVTGAELLAGTYAFAVQIYCDFSGYTDMARGVAKILGFELCINFQHPYLARNPQEFWKRWHISLSTWLRDYLYIPLGGNRQGVARMYFALLLTMLLGGLWHGARWNFVLWGLYHGLLLILFRLFPFSLKPSGIWKNRLWQMLQILFFFQCTCLGWLIFRVETMSQLEILLRTGSQKMMWSSIASDIGYLGYLVLLIPYQLLSAWKQDEFWIFKMPFVFRVLLYVTLYYLMAVYSIYGTKQFIYFQF